ncbi:hypothetical protein C4D60_Mb04t13230 [Musa balbisiana]|uniref:PRA1 family protein n=1 Tax=Musa balbisiana TaxID=52838 RepID=A0A4S8KBP3_MUSBA|nr:hypothetical protein C4D60_Mb04t13230 [Musa balbisiana]
MPFQPLHALLISSSTSLRTLLIACNSTEKKKKKVQRDGGEIFGHGDGSAGSPAAGHLPHMALLHHSPTSQSHCHRRERPGQAPVAQSHDGCNTATSSLVYGNTSSAVRSIKYFALLLCLILAFLCNVQSVRYHTHASFLMSQPVAGPVTPEHAARSLDRGSLFWSLGLRAFYVSFTLFLWVFGPIPMLASSVVMCCLLFFLDTTTELPRAFHLSSFTVEEDVKEEV